jgi:RNase P/RNase MRP subunit p30
MQRHIHIGIAEMCVRKRVLIEIPLRYALKSVSRELKKSVSDIFSNQGVEPPYSFIALQIIASCALLKYVL